MPSTIPALPVFLLHPDQVVNAAAPLLAACFEELRAGFGLQSASAHTLAPDPDSAALIVAPIRAAGYGPCFEALRSSPVYRKYAHKLVVYCPEDGQLPAVRGLYPSVSRQWVRKGWALPAHYISTHIHKFSFRREELDHKDILFSFVGSSRTHPIREKIVQWRQPGGVVIDASAKDDKQYWWEKANKDELLNSFRDVTRRSRFVLCPRGVSASSIRLFETMEAAAVPVIVADDLELPLGPAWEEFSLRVPEREVDDIPKLVEQLEDRATEMGRAARQAWEAYFSPQTTVGSVVGWGQRLLARSHRRPLLLPVKEYTSPRSLKAKLHYALRRHLPSENAR